MYEFAQAPSVCIHDDFVRVYFSCRPKPDSNGQYVSYSAYVDLDRTNLKNIKEIGSEPILRLGELGTFDEFGTYPVSVIKFNNEYRAYFGGWTRCDSVPFNVAIGYATSYDGKVFNKVGDGPILSYSPDEPFILSGPKIRFFNNAFYLYYIAGRKWIIDNGKPEPVYKIRLATSIDGLTWVKANKDLIPSKIELDEAQASPDVFFFNNKYHMFFCYRRSKDYRGKENGYRIGYAFSNDLVNWTRDDSKAGIDVSKDGWDSEMISYPHIFELDGKLHMFYLGNGVGKYGFGLATLVEI
ncbi:MAG: glycosylase [Bacteroidia bacterium]